MHLDLQTIKITPIRQTFDHLARRFGDKAASRYQEGTYDVQQDYLYHYRPTWEPDREIFDERRTAIRMRDWYDLRDPRQYYYSTYTLARARQQEASDANFQHALNEEMIADLPETVRALILNMLLPARHLEWGANMNNTFICAYGYGTAITAAAMYAAGDHLGMAQQISLVGLAVGGEGALGDAKERWLRGPEWQPVRRYIEDLFVVRDWFELFIAQNFVLEALSYTLLYNQLPKFATRNGGAFYSMATVFMKDWYAESARWVDSVVKTAKAESGENEALLRHWIEVYRDPAFEAIKTLAQQLPASDAAACIAACESHFESRIRSAGL